MYVTASLHVDGGIIKTQREERGRQQLGARRAHRHMAVVEIIPSSGPFKAVAEGSKTSQLPSQKLFRATGI